MVRSLAYQVAHVQTYSPATSSPSTEQAHCSSPAFAGPVDSFQAGPTSLRWTPQVADPSGWAQLQGRLNSLRDSGVIR